MIPSNIFIPAPDKAFQKKVIKELYALGFTRTGDPGRTLESFYRIVDESIFPCKFIGIHLDEKAIYRTESALANGRGFKVNSITHVKALIKQYKREHPHDIPPQNF